MSWKIHETILPRMVKRSRAMDGCNAVKHLHLPPVLASKTTNQTGVEKQKQFLRNLMSNDIERIRNWEPVISFGIRIAKLNPNQ